MTRAPSSAFRIYAGILLACGIAIMLTGMILGLRTPTYNPPKVTSPSPCPTLPAPNYGGCR